MVKKDELSIDFSSVTKRFNKLDNKKLITWGLVLAIVLLVFFIRMQPASLPVVDDWARSSINSGLRAQITEQITQQYPALPAENKERLVNEQIVTFTEQNGPAIKQQQEQLANNFRERLRYTGDDGKQYTYLGDLDSYFWIRYTRNWLNTGTACDEITDEGVCREAFIMAPIGGIMGRNPSSHVFVIGWLHKFIGLFKSGYPLPATSFLVPVLAALLGILPAFFIGKKLAGNVGGVFSAVLISLHPLFLSRSIGSDNDVWNVVVPLFIMWMAVEALGEKDLKKKAIYGALAGICAGIFSTFWAAWWFIYIIVLFGFTGSLLFMIVRHVVQKRDWIFWKDKRVVAIAVVLFTFYVVAAVIPVASPNFTVSSYIGIPGIILSSASSLDSAVGAEYWPNVLTTVAELSKSSFYGAVGQLGGKIFFFSCLLGLLLMMLPRNIKKWKWEHYTVLTVGSIISVYLLNAATLSKMVILFLIALPIGIALLLDLWRDYKTDVTASIVVLVWFLATVYSTYSGVRFILLMIPVYGIAVGVTAGRLFEWTSEYLKSEFKVDKRIIYIVVFIIIASTLITPIKTGHGTARGFVPTISDGWWDTLTNIRDNSSPDAIINSWWDFGHWFKYVAERRVSADGTTQGTHVPYWLGKSLVASDEKESIGVIRMLNCGSDGYPSDTENRGAYGKVVTIVQDTLRAQEIVVELVQMDEKDAREYLEAEGFSSEQIDDILTATHCPVVEDFYITSGDMVGKAGVWAHFGLWDFEKAFIVENSRTKKLDEAVPLIVEQTGVSEEEAQRLYYGARALPNQGAVNAYVSPWPGYITHNWLPCRWNTNKTFMQCPLALGIGTQNNVVTTIEGVNYQPDNEENTTLFIGFRQNGQLIQTTVQAPTRLIVADNDSLREIPMNDTKNINIGVLLDTVNSRILLSDPLLTDSIFTQLFYLDGRYNEHFEKFDDRTTITGTRILTWRIDWDGAD